MKFASCRLPTWVPLGLLGCVTDTVPSVPMVIDSALAGIVIAGWIG